MARKNLTSDLVGNKVPDHDYDISVLLIDHDTASIASLTSMFEQFSSTVMSVNEASKAVSIIENQKNIGLVIANIEMPNIDSHPFHTLLLNKDIPLILITPDKKTTNASQFLTNRARYLLKKPISENDIENMWQHVLPKKREESGETKIVKSEDDETMEERLKQIEAFRENIKRQRTTSQASLLGKRPFIRTFPTSETYQNRRSDANAESKTKPVIKMESNVGRRRNQWTRERHMKFLSAISILGDEDSNPKSILKIMNDPCLTPSQVSTHLQKYKAQVEQLNDTLSRNEWRSSANKTFEYPSDYEYPFKASNLAKNFISAEKPIEEKGTEMLKFHLGGKFDLSKHSSFGNVDRVPSGTSNNIPPFNTSPTIDANHTGLVSTSLSSSSLPFLRGLPSSVGASNTAAFQMGYLPQPNPSPNPFQSPSSVLETGGNQTNSYLPPMADAHVLQADLNQMGESYNVLPDSTMSQMNWVSPPESYVLPEANMNVNFPETNTNQMGRVSLGESYVPSENRIPSTVQEGFIHRETSFAALNSVILPGANMTIPQTNMNHMGNASFGGGSVLTQDRISFYETSTTHVSLVSRGVSNGIYSETNMTILETNINQRNWISSRQSDVLPQDMVSSEANTTQAGLVPCDASYAALDNVIPPRETSMEEAYGVSIEDMFSFDINVNDMDMQTLLGSSGASQINTLPNTYIGHDSSSNTQVERGDNFQDDPELMDWIDNLLTEGV